MEETKISLTKRRKILIQMFYRYLLMNCNNQEIKQDILDEIQSPLDQSTANIANEIVDHKLELINLVSKYLSIDWKWNRLPFLVQSVLLIGTYELIYSTTPNAIVINEMTQYVKDNIYDFDYKFINAILDNISKNK